MQCAAEFFLTQEYLPILLELSRPLAWKLTRSSVLQSPWGRSSCVGWPWMKSDCGNDCEQGGNQEDDELREFEWRLGLCWGHGMQRRGFFKQLHDQHKQIEVETNHGADDVDPAPRPDEMLRVTRENRKCEERQRYDAETDGRRETKKMGKRIP